MLDFVLCRYHDARYVLQLEASKGLSVIMKGIQKNQEDRLYQQWLHDEARYTMSFNEYKQKLTPYRKSTKEEKQEILEKYGGV